MTNCVDSRIAQVYSHSTLAMEDISKAAAILGRKGGQAKTKAQNRARRINGKKGGRPKKVA
jgi:hypothetical protein